MAGLVCLSGWLLFYLVDLNSKGIKMATVVVSSTVKDLVVDVAVKVQGYKVSVTGQPDQVVSAPEATFLDVAPGDYVATVVLVDTAGADIGEAQSANFTVAATSQTVAVPAVVSVVVS